ELDEAGYCVDRAVNDEAVGGPGQAAQLPREPCRAIYGSVNPARVCGVDAARQVRRAPRDERAVDFVNPVLVEARAVERREARGPEVWQVRPLYVEEVAQPHAEGGDGDGEDDEEPLGCRVTPAEHALDCVREVEARVAVGARRLFALSRERRAAAPLLSYCLPSGGLPVSPFEPAHPRAPLPA